MKNTLILTPNSYPYGKGDVFLETEIHYLAEVFDEIYIFPSIKDGPKRPLPATVKVYDTFILSEEGSLKVSNFRSLLYILFQPWFWKDLWRLLPSGKFSTANISRIFRFAKNGYRKFLALDQFVKNNKIDTSSLKLYSYWLSLIHI